MLKYLSFGFIILSGVILTLIYPINLIGNLFETNLDWVYPFYFIFIITFVLNFYYFNVCQKKSLRSNFITIFLTVIAYYSIFFLFPETADKVQDYKQDLFLFGTVSLFAIDWLDFKAGGGFY